MINIKYTNIVQGLLQNNQCRKTPMEFKETNELERQRRSKKHLRQDLNDFIASKGHEDYQKKW